MSGLRELLPAMWQARRLDLPARLNCSQAPAVFQMSLLRSTTVRSPMMPRKTVLA